VAVVYWLNGTLTELGLTSTDFVELPAQSLCTGGTSALEHGGLPGLQAHREGFAGSCVRIWSPSAKDPLWGATHGADQHCVVVELEVGEPILAVKAYRFAAEAVVKGGEGSRGMPIGPRLYEDGSSGVDGCAVGHPVALTKSALDKAQARALLKLTQLYPAIAQAGRVASVTVVPPTLGGHGVVGSAAKYASTGLTATTDIRDLYLTGRDLATSGVAADFQSGWATANAVLGYTAAELLGGKNVASDLPRYW
jgi:hypothetical protein